MWQNQETRQRYHIGTLSSLNGEYTFSYELSGKRRTLIETMENGYRPHLAFRDVNKVYKSNRLFDAFARRLPDKRRPDFPELLQSFGLPKDYTDMDLLRATGGRLVTDPYEFVAPIYRYGNHFDFDFFVAGWRYYEGEKALRELNIGEKVRIERELKNQKDKKAVVILSTKSGYKLGYVPAFYSGFMFDVIEKQDQFCAKVEKINFNAKAQLKVVISVVGQTTINEYEETDFNIIERLELV